MNKNTDFRHLTVFDVPEQSPGFLLWRVSTSWRSAIEAVLKPLSLTHPQFVVLTTLGWLTRNGERVTQAAIGKLAGLDPNTISQILRGLEIKRLIKRVQSSDVRAKNPLLTTQGSEVLARALPAVESADVQFFKTLTHQEAKDMLSIFQKLTIRS
jgi:MarR family transcriptional regulator, organic hydroperoxide resistance regulator